MTCIPWSVAFGRLTTIPALSALIGRPPMHQLCKSSIVVASGMHTAVAIFSPLATEREYLPEIAHGAAGLQLLLATFLLLAWLTEVTERTFETIVTAFGVHEGAWLAATAGMEQ